MLLRPRLLGTEQGCNAIGNEEERMGHIETAVGMFNAGEVLREFFQLHATGTESEKARRRSAVIPMIVVYVLGIEVGIKALIEKQGQKPPHIHDLQTLYDNLNSSIQSRIEHKLKSLDAALPRADSLLSLHRNSFEEWRYMGNFGNAKAVNPFAVAATLRSIIDVHTESYGMETSKPVVDSGTERSVPTSIQEAAAEYMKQTGVAEVDDASKGSPEV